MEGIPRIPTPPLEPSPRLKTSTTTRTGVEPKYSQSIPIQTTGAGMGVTTTAGLSEPSASYSTLPKDGAIRASPAHSPGRLVPPQRPSTTCISATFQGEDGDIIETGQPRVTAPSVSTVSTVTPVTKDASRQDALDTARR